MTAYKVIQWGTGGVGVWALRQVLDAPDLELVGLKCATDAKAGVDAGIIAGRDPGHNGDQERRSAPGLGR